MSRQLNGVEAKIFIVFVAWANTTEQQPFSASLQRYLLRSLFNPSSSVCVVDNFLKASRVQFLELFLVSMKVLQKHFEEILNLD